MALTFVSVEKAKELIDKGALIVDIRGADEFKAEHIKGARNITPDHLEQAGLPSSNVVFHCRSGMRTRQNAALEEKACPDGYVMEGGIEAWKKAGFPVELDRSQPLPINRQVQMVAGGLVLLGTFLGATSSNGFLLIPAIVGIGLMFSGATGRCHMAQLLMNAHWNRTSHK